MQLAYHFQGQRSGSPGQACTISSKWQGLQTSNFGILIEDLQSKRSHDQYEPCWPNDLKIENEQLYHQSLHLVLWRSTKMHITDSRSDLKGQGHTLTSSMSHLCLLLIRETKCCTCVVRGGCQAGHTMSTEPGNYTSLYMSHSSRFYAIIWDMRK